MNHAIINEMVPAVVYIGPEKVARQYLSGLAAEFKGGVLPLWINLYKVVPNVNKSE